MTFQVTIMEPLSPTQTSKQTNKSNPQRSDKVALVFIVLWYPHSQIISTTSWTKVLLELYKEFILFFLNHISTFSCWNASKVKCLILVFRSVLCTILICLAILDKRGICCELYLRSLTELGFIFKEKCLQP